MNRTINIIVAAAAVMIAGVANAKITDFDNQSGGDGNSSLTFIALDKVGTPVSLTADLGYFFDQFRPVGSPGMISDGAGGLTDGYLGSANPLGLANKAGTTVTWNFANNTTTINGVVSTSTNGKANDWSTKFASFSTQAQIGETKWAVIAGDKAGYYDDGASIGAPIAASGLYQDSSELLVTADPTQLNFQNRLNNTNTQNVNAAAGAGHNFVQGVNTVDNSTGNGAVVANSGFAYAGNVGSFNGNFGGNFTWTTLADVGKTQNFYHLTDAPQDPSGALSIDKPYVTKFAGTFTYSGGQLTYAVPAAAVPEPESIALALAGLFVVAGVARRRAAK